MNKKQLRVLWLGIAALVGCFVYPPWQSTYRGIRTQSDYGWIIAPPSGSMQIDISTLAAQCLPIVLVTGGLVFSLSSRSPGSNPRASASASPADPPAPEAPTAEAAPGAARPSAPVAARTADLVQARTAGLEEEERGVTPLPGRAAPRAPTLDRMADAIKQGRLKTVAEARYCNTCRSTVRPTLPDVCPNCGSSDLAETPAQDAQVLPSTEAGPSTETRDPLTYLPGTRWPRFFARHFDLWLEGLLIYGLCLVASLYSASFARWLDGLYAMPVCAILYLPSAMIMDAMLYAIFGNTLGKALLGLKVETEDGKRLRVSQYLRRNFSLWVEGFSIGIPLLSLYTMARQSNMLKEGWQASYDELPGFRVRHASGWPSIFTILFICLLGLMAWANGHERQGGPGALRRTLTDWLVASLPDYSWENPFTRLSASIDPRWKYTVQPNTSGHLTYLFTEQTGRAVVALGMQRLPGALLDEYVREFQKDVPNMRFSDGGRFFEKDGRPTWQGSGSMVDSTGVHLQVQVAQVGSAFWRVVTIQSMPYDYSDQLVSQLQIALWSTVK